MYYMSIHEYTWTAPGCRPNSTCKASASASCQDISTCKSAHSLSNWTDQVGVTPRKRLDQGHLHPKLEVPGLKCPSWASTVGAKHYRKEQFEQLVNCYSEHLHMSARPVENAHNTVNIPNSEAIMFTIRSPGLCQQFLPLTFKLNSVFSGLYQKTKSCRFCNFRQRGRRQKKGDRWDLTDKMKVLGLEMKPQQINAAIAYY
jgi:hypothetical protein